jgi:hypothetical protein
MVQTEALEITTLYLTKIGLSISLISLHFTGFHWTHLITIPALLLGWTNALAIKAISETIGTNVTNAAIFGMNNCTKY